MSSSHYRKLETMYRRAPVNGLYQPAITIEDGAATIEIAVSSIALTEQLGYQA